MTSLVKKIFGSVWSRVFSDTRLFQWLVSAYVYITKPIDNILLSVRRSFTLSEAVKHSYGQTLFLVDSGSITRSYISLGSSYTIGASLIRRPTDGAYTMIHVKLPECTTIQNRAVNPTVVLVKDIDFIADDYKVTIFRQKDTLDLVGVPGGTIDKPKMDYMLWLSGCPQKSSRGNLSTVIREDLDVFGDRAVASAWRSVLNGLTKADLDTMISDIYGTTTSPSTGIVRAIWEENGNHYISVEDSVIGSSFTPIVKEGDEVTEGQQLFDTHKYASSKVPGTLPGIIVRGLFGPTFIPNQIRETISISGKRYPSLIGIGYDYESALRQYLNLAGDGVYTSSEFDGLLAVKADSSTLFTKSEIDLMLNNANEEDDE